MKITKNLLRRIIKEEKAKLQEVPMGAPARSTSSNPGIFSDDYIYDLLADEVELFLRENPTSGPVGLTRTEQDMIKASLLGAFENIVEDFGLE